MTVPLIAHHDVTVYQGDALEVLRTLPAGSVQCVVTSPPYYGLRDYGTGKWEGGEGDCDHTPIEGANAGRPGRTFTSQPPFRAECRYCGARRVDQQLGLEPSPAEYVAALVAVFRETRRVLADDGVLWLNIGDSYSAAASGPRTNWGRLEGKAQAINSPAGFGDKTGFLPAKNMLGIPWRLAFALQDDGWTLRNDVIWCLSGGAWVWARTAKGDMPVMVKDLVRLDPASVRLWNGEKWTRVLGWGRSTDTSERLEIVLRSGERIGCTGGHEWPTRRGNIHARDLRIGDVIETCTLPQPDSACTPAYLTDDVLWLVGLYLAEGSRSGGVVQLSLHADEVGWLPRIRDAVTHLGGTLTHGIIGNKLGIRASGRVLRAVLDSYIGGATAHDKHLRNAAWSLPNVALRLLVQGYLDGDGHHDVKNDRWRLGFTRNYALERDLRTAAARLGATITLHPRTVEAFGRTHKMFRGEWRWTPTQHSNTKDRGEIIEIRASRARQFWDIAVEDDPHLFALASGVLTHNCKPNAMPESVTDRLSTRHEHVFLLAKSRRYWFNLDAIREDRAPATLDRYRYAFKPNSNPGSSTNHLADGGMITAANELGRNPGDVWQIPTTPFPGAHFACMPPELARRCILAGCPEDGTVLDPFTGSGTTAMVARNLGRRFVGAELNPAYFPIIEKRIGQEPFQFDEVTA